MRFREATNADRERVVAHVKGCLEEFGLSLDFETSDADLLDIEETYSRHGGVFLLVEQDGALLGTIGISPVRGMGVPPMRVSGVSPKDSGVSTRDGSNTHGRDAHATLWEAKLRKMYVDSAARGRGLGRQLLEMVIDQARMRGFARLKLETTDDMIAAQRLYESVGFRQIEETPESPRCQRVYVLDLT